MNTVKNLKVLGMVKLPGVNDESYNKYLLKLNINPKDKRDADNRRNKWLAI